jgi:hypothetical protein
MENKIVSAFMFSEPHEQELLWVKFNIEDPYIAEWIITESSYTFQGKRKKLYLEEILKQERFTPFRNKIHYIKLDTNFHFEYEPPFKEIFKRKVKRFLNKNFAKKYEFVTYSELASFYAEMNQRQACVPYIQKKYKPTDIVILCDTDEMFDFNDGKIEEFEKILSQNKTPFYIQKFVFCYDFDNYTNRERKMPIIRVHHLKKAKVQFIKHPMSILPILKVGVPFIFEYTFCFSKDAIWKKLSSFAHVTEMNKDDLDFCFENNISFISKDKIDKTYKEKKENFYEKLILDRSNSPSFIREHFNNLKTGIVDPNYIENRKKNHIERR